MKYSRKQKPESNQTSRSNYSIQKIKRTGEHFKHNHGKTKRKFKDTLNVNTVSSTVNCKGKREQE